MEPIPVNVSFPTNLKFLQPRLKGKSLPLDYLGGLSIFDRCLESSKKRGITSFKVPNCLAATLTEDYRVIVIVENGIVAIGRPPSNEMVPAGAAVFADRLYSRMYDRDYKSEEDKVSNINAILADLTRPAPNLKEKEKE